MATTRRDIALNVIADIREYQQKFAKLPGFTEKQAAVAARRLERQLTAAASKTAREAEKAAKAAARAAEQAERESARERIRQAEAVQSANARLSDIIEQQERDRMSASERAAAALRKELAVLDQLKEAGADAAKVDQARVKAIEAGASRIAAARQREIKAAGFDAPATGKASAAMDDFADAQGRAASRGRELSNATASVAQQLPDVISQLSAGAPAGQVFAQQGLQVVQSNMSLTLSAGKGLARFLVGPFGVALAAAATAAAFVANAVDESADSVATFTEQLKNNELSLRVTSLQAYTQAQIDLRSAVAEAELALYQETGVLDSLDIAQMRSVQTTRESARAVLLEAAAIGARLEVQRQSLQARVDANDFTVIEKAQGVDDAARERLKVLSREIPLANQRLDALKEEVDQKVINVNETYNEIRAAKEKAEADREAEKAARSSGRASVSASKASADAAREAARATEEWLSTLDLVVEASARLDAEREILAQAAEGPTASQIDSWRELGSAVEELVPQAAIDRTTQLLLLLDQLELAATADGRAAAALADDISRVRSALAVEEADRWIAEMDSAAAATEDASGRITGSVRSMVSSVGELLGGAGPLGGLVSGLADAERISARMTERAMQRGASAEDIAGIADAAEGRSDAISAAAGIAGPFLDEIANGAAGGRAVAKMAAGFITGLAKGIGPFIQAFVLNADKIVIALVKAGPQIVAGIIKAVVRIGKGIARSFVDGIGEGLRRVARQIARVVVDAVTPGNRRRRRIRVGDTPGPVRVPRGGTIEAAPGDMVVAARNTQGLRNQLGPAASGSGGETTVTTILDVRDGPIRLGISRSTTRELDRRGVGRDMTGRRRAY